MAFISLLLSGLVSAFVSIKQGRKGKYSAKKISVFREFFVWMQSFYEVECILEWLAEEAPAPLIQPDSVAFAQYFKVYEKKISLKPEKKIMLGVLRDPMWRLQNFLFATDKTRKKMLKETVGYSRSQICVTP